MCIIYHQVQGDNFIRRHIEHSSFTFKCPHLMKFILKLLCCHFRNNSTTTKFFLLSISSLMSLKLQFVNGTHSVSREVANRKQCSQSTQHHYNRQQCNYPWWYAAIFGFEVSVFASAFNTIRIVILLHVENKTVCSYT